MASELQSLIMADMSGNDVPSVPPNKKMKSAIGCSEAMKSAYIDYAETLSTGAASAAKLMERMMSMAIGKTGKSVRT